MACRTHLTVFQWHGDTFEVPEGGALLVQGKTCKNQAFKVGHYAYGLQFHIEATPDMVMEWMEDQEIRLMSKRSKRERSRSVISWRGRHM